MLLSFVMAVLYPVRYRHASTKRGGFQLTAPKKENGMPHITIDYSPNLEPEIDIARLCDCLRVAAIKTGILPMAGIRVRAMAATHYSIADGNPAHGYVDIALRLRAGRDLEAKKTATNHVFESARNYLSSYMAQNPLALSFEMRDIDADLSPKTGTIRDHLEDNGVG
jgi:5-carboxymethyl-2-hydroxymuconate isomerase